MLNTTLDFLVYSLLGQSLFVFYSEVPFSQGQGIQFWFWVSYVCTCYRLTIWKIFNVKDTHVLTPGVFWPMLNCSQCTSCTGILLFFDNRSNHSFEQNHCVWFCLTKLISRATQRTASLYIEAYSVVFLCDKAQKNDFWRIMGLRKPRNWHWRHLGLFLGTCFPGY